MKFEIVDKNEGRTIEAKDIPNGTVFVGVASCFDNIGLYVKSEHDGRRIVSVTPPGGNGDIWSAPYLVKFTNYKPVKKLTVKV